MTSPVLFGPYDLSERTVNRVVPRGITGTFLLGRKAAGAVTECVILLTGRAENDLNSELKDYIGKYDMFEYSFAYNLYEAFHVDCRNYHKLNGLAKKNKIQHPVSPAGCGWVCPVCENQ